MKTDNRNTTHRPAGKARKKPLWRRILPFAIGLLLLLLVLNGFRPKPIQVELAVVLQGPLTVTVLEEGKTRIRDRYVIAAPVPGFMRRVELEAGDKIEEGKTMLATIQPEVSSFLDPRTRAQTEARVQAAEALVKQRQAGLERARAELDLAQKEKVRGQELRAKGALAEREWDTIENNAIIKARELRTSEFALNVAEFELQQSQAALMQAAEPQSENTPQLEIPAPVNGFVLNVFQESARVVTAGTQIMEVGDPRDLEIEAEILSQDAAGIRAGADVTIEQWGGEQPLRAKVRTVEPAAFTKISALGVEEQRVKVIADFVEPLPADRFLGDRYRVETRVVTWSAESVLKIPTGALFRRGNEWMTFAVIEGKARMTKVEIGHNNGVEAEVLSGLQAGQDVVLHPPDALSDGGMVKKRE